MNKSEFLAILRQQLEGEMPSNEIYGNIRYYDEYIEQQILSGRTEAEVMEELGDPRLIAKTLVDADEAPYQRNSYEETSYQYSGESQNRYEQQDPTSNQEESVRKYRHLDLTTWYGKALIILAAAALIFLLVTVVSALLPILLVLVLVSVIISLLRRKH